MISGRTKVGRSACIHRASPAVMLGPEVSDQPEINKVVKAFEEGFHEKLRKAEKERATRAAKQDGGDD
ncbi:MAG TPA: hypothetical protein VFQ05_03990 [Candidatus Eisenbacteria bacterium]|nr:hypothetical protein [Candidatus Eisenbacteria bacterium]